MFCLVRYTEDNILHIVSTKQLKKQKGYVLAPYKKMGYYEAYPLLYDNDKMQLNKKKKHLEENVGESQVIQNLHTPENQEVSLNSEIEVIQNLHTPENQEVNLNSKQTKKKNSHKRHSCLFCKKKIFQIVRHWQNVHSTELQVREIMMLHTTNPSRKRKIDILRKRGDYEFNVHSNSENLIVTRASQAEEIEYIPCPSCFGYFSKQNLRHHKRKCSPSKGSRHLQGNSRRLTRHIHERASETLRNVIAPDMFHDEIGNQVFFDEILVTYGNYLCIKYTESHLKNHIRAQLRLLGRFMLRAKSHDNTIKNCMELMHSRNIDTIRKAIDDLAEIDILTNTYKHPTNARTLIIQLKKIIGVLKSESDKKEDEDLMRKTKGFSRRVKQELAPYINRICKNSENKLKRIKQVKDHQLPVSAEIGHYLDKLFKVITDNQRQLHTTFSLSAWTQLTTSLMVYLAAFNRKRPGETQRIEVADFYNRECINETDLENLEEFDKNQAKKYERIGFRGKLGNSTALLIDKVKILPGIKLILKYRDQAGVHKQNPFLFAKPSTHNKNETFDAYRCHNHFCDILNINMKNLTFTKLRKHFATQVAKKGTSQEEEKRCSTYMSHDYNIHKRIYDQSTTFSDITTVSKHLEATLKETGSVSHKNNNQNKKHNFKRKVGHDETGDTKKLKVTLKRLSNKTQSRDLENISIEDSYRESDKGMTSDDDEYSLDNDNESDEPSLEEVEECLGKRQKRTSWTTVEREITRKFFKKEIRKNKEIDNDKIRNFKFIFKNKISRPLPLIKQWIIQENLKFKQRECGIKGTRPRFSTPEKELIDQSIERHSLDTTEPSIEEFEELISNHEIFQQHRRSALSLLRKYKEVHERKYSI